jgi:hypothetical protein
LPLDLSNATIETSCFRSDNRLSTAIIRPAILIVHNDIVRAIDRGQLTAMTFLDLSSVFDTVDHDILPAVLRRRFSIEDSVLEWFQTYLFNRTRTFIAGKNKTEPLPVSCSVPQGSVLGPVEFIAYTEDVAVLFDHDHHQVNHQLYADDQQIYIHINPGMESVGLSKLVDCILDLSEWCASRRLQLNAAKTELIWFGSRAMLRRLPADCRSTPVGSSVLESVDVVHNLGVLFDSELDDETAHQSCRQRLLLPSSSTETAETTRHP